MHRFILVLFLSVFFGGCSKGDNGTDNPPADLPAVSINDARVNRKPTGSACRFYIDLSSAPEEEVSVHYTTQAGTAQSGEDFEAASGTLTFQPGEKEKSIDITIKADSLRRSDQEFYVLLSEASNAKIDVKKATGTIINDGTYLTTDDTGFSTSMQHEGYSLVWQDEFEEDKLDEDDWNYETGGGGWGNNELENYTTRPENLFLSSGNLIIEAREEEYGGNDYTSARITTKDKQEFTYGRVDIRAKLPVAQGLWPALWMLGSNISTVPWPKCGETDIMEVVGSHPSRVVGSLHWEKADGTEGTYNNNKTLESGDFSDEFHVFSLIWDHDSIQILLDNQPYVTASRDDLNDGTYAFDQPFFFIFNVAVGGNWPGSPDSTTQFPQRMFVDYIRVFQKN